MALNYHVGMEVEEVAAHRNGICGAPFHVVTFRIHVDGEHRDRAMVGIVFEADEHIAVFDREQLGKGVIAFGGVDDGQNSWRGDCYETELRAAVKDYEAAREAACEVRDCGAKKVDGLRVCERHARGMAAASEEAR